MDVACSEIKNVGFSSPDDEISAGNDAGEELDWRCVGIVNNSVNDFPSCSGDGESLTVLEKEEDEKV